MTSNPPQSHIQTPLLLTEYYRPKTRENLILPPRLMKKINGITVFNATNYIFHGEAGLGKTSAALSLMNDLRTDYIKINASDDRNIDTIRTNVRAFASTKSLNGLLKFVIFDEADYLNPNSSQPALRGMIEEYANTTRFIFTCNYLGKIIPAIQSRCTVINFNPINTDESEDTEYQIYQFLLKINKDDFGETLTENKISELCINAKGDMRSALTNFQSAISSGEFNESRDSEKSSHLASAIFYDIIQKKDFKRVSEVIFSEKNIPDNIYGKLAQALRIKKHPSFPTILMILNQYQYQHQFVDDKHVNLAACLYDIGKNSP